VQRHPHVEQHVLGRRQGVVVAWAQDGTCRLHPAQGVDVAKAAAPLLEVGLEEEGDLARLGRPLGHPTGQNREPPAGVGPPAPERPLEHRGHHGGVAGHQPDRQGGGGGVEVAVGQGQGLPRRAHGVAQLHAGVPHRVPEPVGHGGHAVPAGLVEEPQVEVAARRQLAPAVAANGHEGETAVRSPGGLREALGQPAVGHGGQRPAQRPPPQRGVGDDRRPDLAETSH
jgi:hypothetical protein